MKRGLILKDAGAIKGELRAFTAEQWRPVEGSIPSGLWELGIRLGTNAAEALAKFDPAGNGITWLSGPAATKALARKFGLKYRVRAPGAGRKPLEPEAKLIAITPRLTRAGIKTLKAQAKRHDRAIGAHIEVLVDAEEARSGRS